jgi:hypothetical protein
MCAPVVFAVGAFRNKLLPVAEVPRTPSLLDETPDTPTPLADCAVTPFPWVEVPSMPAPRVDKPLKAVVGVTEVFSTSSVLVVDVEVSDVVSVSASLLVPY